MSIPKLLCLNLLVMASGAFAALVEIDPDWKEVDVPAPPAFNKDKLIPLEMPSYVSLKFGVDPSTITVASDRVVRYVMVTTNSSGSVNAMYEGIRCTSREFKTYARLGSSAQWNSVKNPQWRALDGNNTSPHALALAIQGACDGRAAPASSAADVVRGLTNRVLTSGN